MKWGELYLLANNLLFKISSLELFILLKNPSIEL